jgi:hypothetical protein
MEDILALYAAPYEAERPVVCIDEKSKELHSTPHGQIALEPGSGARQDYEYQRNGTANLFLSIEPLAGRRRVRVTDRRTSADFADELRILSDEDYPEADVIRLVADNLNTHGAWCLYERFEPAEARRIASRFEWHYTPEHASWLNVAELELSVFARQCLNRRIEDKDKLIREAATWNADRNARHKAIDWQFTAENARVKLKRLYPIVKEHNPS